MLNKSMALNIKFNKLHHLVGTYYVQGMGFPGGSAVKKSSCQCRGHKFDPWVGKVPWRRKWQPTAVFLPGESHHGQRSLTSYSPWGRVRHN